ncbi:Flagellar biosynthesis protein FlhB [hydrothermal vent metagenome]|uniref:Flagellar biosynthetic protein FlhB n=1 Tax=hydrothermal vent metagenome TaxID=652676 RepID=A0A3B0WE69_9ZZZZ
MSEETGQEKTEQPTAKRLKETRDKGQVPRSKELNTMMLLMGSAAGFIFMGDSVLGGIRDLFKRSLSIQNAQEINADGILQALSDAALQSLMIIAPLFLLFTVIVLLTPLGIGGWSFSMKAISFKFDKIDPVKGMGRIFSMKGLMELAKVLAKFALVSAISVIILWSLTEELLGLGNEPLEAAIFHVATLCGWAFLACSSALILVALIDVPFQLWQHNKQLKMTKQEIKDESKETDGRPEVKGRIRTLQQTLSQRRMMEAVPAADVILTNPTHYAVALKYDQFNNKAPVIVAKGADLIAFNIRSIAEQNGVAIVSAPPLTRALYASTEIDQEIPAGLYVAVATILTYVYQLKTVYEHGGVVPEKPDDLPIPDELKDVLKRDI